MRVCLLVVALGAVGCGSSSNPVSPSPTPTPTPTVLDLTGTWRGSLTVAISGAPVTASVTLPLTQSGLTVAGEFVSTNDLTGRIDGTLSDRTSAATFAGTLTLTTPAADANVRCIGTGAITGTVAQPLRWTAARVAFGNCAGEAENVTFALAR